MMILKTISLVLGRFTGYFKRDRSIFILYFIAGLLCTLVFFFAYTNLMPNVTRLQKNEYSNRYYTFKFENDTHLDGQLLDKLHQYSFEAIYYCSKVLPNSIQIPGTESIGATETGNGANVLVCETNIINFSTVIGRNFFSQDELAGNRAAVVLPYDFLSDGEAPQDVYINSEKFDVVGILDTGYSDIIIPYNSFIKLNVPVSSCEIALTQVLGYEDSLKFTQELLSCFSGATVVRSPADYYNNYLGDIQMLFFFVIAIYAVFIMLFAFLVKFMVENSSYECAVFLLVGASRRYMLGILMLESLSLCAFQWLIAVALYKSPFYSLIDKINLYKDLHIGMSDCLIVLLTMLLVTGVIMLPFYSGIVKRTARQVLSEYTY